MIDDLRGTAGAGTAHREAGSHRLHCHAAECFAFATHQADVSGRPVTYEVGGWSVNTHQVRYAEALGELT